ncbi:hypothetical protein [Mucilaginibacter segetis]|uniref:Uncharacterized protein n=1 Tax=Mucilaginibacter segetis TaxID=2793071 RepID=A0A934PSE6_9SPHI|nr:hypothetical protein [Mucilaginibacter segetis]MBK0379938.1 hypothetical protein [Mucilaginibacter segetis]
MKPYLLFPYKARFVGLALIAAHVPVRAIWEAINPDIDQSHRLPVNPGDSLLFTNSHLFFIASTVLVLSGLFLIAFSKEKVEDEQISKLRLDCLQWAIYLNYFLLTLSVIFTNGINFTDVLRLNLWVPLLFFIIRFRWVIYWLGRPVNQENL